MSRLVLSRRQRARAGGGQLTARPAREPVGREIEAPDAAAAVAAARPFGRSLSAVPVFPHGTVAPAGRPVVQPKLAVGAATSPLEVEADEAADQVMRGDGLP